MLEKKNEFEKPRIWRSGNIAIVSCTQRMTSMAYSIADGYEKDPTKLRPEIRRQIIK